MDAHEALYIFEERLGSGSPMTMDEQHELWLELDPLEAKRLEFLMNARTDQYRLALAARKLAESN
jgi:hypothetical protein